MSHGSERSSFGGPIQLENRVHPDLPDGLFRVRLLAVVLAAAQFAPDLDMSALLERGGELSELAEDDATVPFGVLDVLAVLLVGALGCQRECGPSASLPRKPMRVTLFWYKVVISVSLNFPYPARVTLGEAQREGPAPKCQALHLRRVRRRRKP